MNRPPDAEPYVDPLSDYEPAEYSDALAEALAEETVEGIEARPFATISTELTVRQAVAELARLKVSSLAVVDNDKLVGIFTERDVLERAAERFSAVADQPVTTLMTAEPIVVYQCDASGAALAAIAAGGYRHVPVMNVNEELVGMISPRRVFDFLEQRFE